MKKTFLTILLMMASITCYAVDEYTIYQPWDTGAFQLYYVAGGTETAATYTVTPDSISLIVTGGFQPGTTSFKLAGVGNYDTFLEFKTWVELYDSSSSTTDPTVRQAMQGTWNILIPDDVYEDTPMSALATVTVPVGVLTATNISQLAVDTSSTTFYSRYIPADGNGKRTKIKYVITSFTGTTPVIKIFNNSDVQQYPTVSLTSGSPCYIGDQGAFPSVIGTGKERLEVRMESAAAVTAGYMLIGYSYE